MFVCKDVQKRELLPLTDEVLRDVPPSYVCNLSGLYVFYNEIQEVIGTLADKINEDYSGRELTTICVLQGASRFHADLTLRLTMPRREGSLRLSSYVSTKSTGEVKIYDSGFVHQKLVEGKNVLIIEDIADTNLSLLVLQQNLLSYKPANLKTCVLLQKPERQEHEVQLDYIGLIIANHFVIGYGLDFEERFRDLKGIFVYKNS